MFGQKSRVLLNDSERDLEISKTFREGAQLVREVEIKTSKDVTCWAAMCEPRCNDVFDTKRYIDMGMNKS